NRINRLENLAAIPFPAQPCPCGRAPPSFFLSATSEENASELNRIDLTVTSDRRKGMSNWISSKLKVAETFFEQIDQQAAESLKKNEEQLFE
ncbi:unnamed protein product, partial [Linum tenue]